MHALRAVSPIPAPTVRKISLAGPLLAIALCFHSLQWLILDNPRVCAAATTAAPRNPPKREKKGDSILAVYPSIHRATLRFGCTCAEDGGGGPLPGRPQL